ncbi:mRNA export factor GLE1-like [Humulus lupulus]|uniref:mRNA export factor GLE1-like n=1 Tax=Humulus lupulus TaxID=3486 RepID=UPI002B4176EB|nr:mRNA export factor GLE1-like [Humulus lupulus]
MRNLVGAVLRAHWFLKSVDLVLATLLAAINTQNAIACFTLVMLAWRWDYGDGVVTAGTSMRLGYRCIEYDDDDFENDSALEIQPYLMEEKCKTTIPLLIMLVKALDNHLTAIQRDYELRSQIEERKIRSDAAYEGAKRKEKALLEEKLRQEKAKAEAEAKLRAEEANRVAMEAQRREAKEAAEREANEASSQAAVQKEALGLQTKAKTKESEFEKPINSASAGAIGGR